MSATDLGSEGSSGRLEDRTIVEDHATPYRSPRALGGTLASLVAITLVVHALAVFAAAALMRSTADVGLGTVSQARAAIAAAELRYGLIQLAGTVVFVVTVPVFLAWFHRAYANLPALGAADRQFSTGWAVGAWFVPVLNLVRPMRMAEEIVRGSTPVPHGSLVASPRWSLVRLWWSLWLAVNGLAWSATLNAETIEFWLAHDAARVLLDVAALALVLRVTNGQESSAHTVTPGTASHATKLRLMAPTAAACVALVLFGGVFSLDDDRLAALPDDSASTPEGSTDAHLPPPDGTEAPEPPRSQRDEATPERVAVLVDDLSTGDCFDDPPDIDDGVGEVVLVPCETPHDNEVFALPELAATTDAPYPDEDELAFDSKKACEAHFEAYVGVPYSASGRLWLWAFYPNADGWAAGDRIVVCMLYDSDLQKLAGSVAGTGM